MSTILKALRRLEEEKASVESGRPLREQVAAAGPMSPPRRSGRRWLAAVAALSISAAAGAGVIFWLFGESPGTRTDEVAAAEAPAPAAAPSRGVPARVASAGPPDDAFASDVEIVARPDPLPRLADASPLEPKSRPNPGARRPVEDSVAAARARAAAQQRAEVSTAEALPPAPPPAPTGRVAQAPPQAPVPDAKPSAPPAPAPRPERVARAPEPELVAPAPEPEPVAPVPEPAPVVAAKELASAPAVRERPAPRTDILVERTRWHPLSDRRSAWLRVAGESRQVVEGDVVDGMMVAEIQPSGVVFDRDGEKTRRGIGER